MTERGNRGLKRVVNAFFCSLRGMTVCFRTEEAFRQEIFAAAALIPLGLWLGGNADERLFLCGSVMFVLVVELLNTGIERAIDRISFERHELSRDAKDMGSAAVFLSILICIFTWIVILAR
ncbi:MAG: diacylglycerol kinase [Proteobacteria bacterium]|nr:diacylglycerol kinase [Pseudomonadota bacterium]